MSSAASALSKTEKLFLEETIIFTPTVLLTLTNNDIAWTKESGELIGECFLFLFFSDFSKLCVNRET